MDPGLVVAGRKRKSQPPPPHIIVDALLHPDRDPVRPWLRLLGDERRPVITPRPPDRVVWTDLWPYQPDAVIEFVISPDGAGGAIEWILWLEEPVPDASRIGHLCHRVTHLINADLRLSFGQ